MSATEWPLTAAPIVRPAAIGNNEFSAMARDEMLGMFDFDRAMDGDRKTLARSRSYVLRSNAGGGKKPNKSNETYYISLSDKDTDFITKYIGETCSVGTRIVDGYCYIAVARGIDYKTMNHGKHIKRSVIYCSMKISSKPPYNSMSKGEKCLLVSNYYYPSRQGGDDAVLLLMPSGEFIRSSGAGLVAANPANSVR